ncbi:hypothetical protein [Bradyrhizobium mercantei]|uniref:hypothetical protein n=1 Tax=Bradyrhizobium mercantei TaxID=1904807 RepID=UPI0013563995|nr:hypothetical protein [Bradyrhizobium mercantei]
MLIAPNTSRDNELSPLMVPAENPFSYGNVAGALPKYRKQPHAKQPAVAALDQGT